MNRLIEETFARISERKLAIHVLYSDDEHNDVVDSFDGKDFKEAVEYFRYRMENLARLLGADNVWNLSVVTETCNAACISATNEQIPDALYSLNFVELN